LTFVDPILLSAVTKRRFRDAAMIISVNVRRSSGADAPMVARNLQLLATSLFGERAQGGLHGQWSFLNQIRKMWPSSSLRRSPAPVQPRMRSPLLKDLLTYWQN